MSNLDAAERPTAFPWPLLFFGVAVAGPCLLARFYPLAWPGLDDLGARVIGVGLGIAGILLFGWAAITMLQRRTTVRPDRGADALVTAGPFHYVRNPIYLADVLMLLALADLTKNIWFAMFAALFAAFVTLSILAEERHLEAKFGDAFRAYKAKTRRWI